MKKYIFFTIVLSFLFGFNFINSQSNDKKTPDVVYYSNFEDGQTGEWEMKGDAVIIVTDEMSYKGKYSLFTKGRTKAWNGPEIFLTDKIFKNGTYEFSAWVKIKDGQPESIMTATAQREKKRQA